MSETRRRWLTAIGLVPAMVVIVLVLPAIAFHAALVLVVAGGAWEWSRLAGLSPVPVYAAVAAGSLGLVLVSGAVPAGGFAWVGVAWWLAALVAIVRFRGPVRAPARPALALAGWLVLVPAGATLAEVHAGPDGPALAMTLLAVVWAADTGAWFTGRRFGRTRLAPHVSPGKTWEGVAGGIAAAAATGAVATWWLGRPWAELLPAAVLASGASVVGDLYESVSKRRAGVKDSGRLLPGHGGILDRIDGLTAAAPVYAVVLAW